MVRKKNAGDPVEKKKLDVNDQAMAAVKRLQKRGPSEEKQLENVETAPVREELK